MARQIILLRLAFSVNLNTIGVLFKLHREGIMGNQTYWIWGALVVGLICGAIPMIMGAKKNKIGLGFAGFILCIVGSLILGALLAVPVCSVFIWLINKKVTENYKACPYCAEQILTEAKVCKHCGRELE